jgi:glycosyltransferase involved in cell wall biosynthesis
MIASGSPVSDRFTKLNVCVIVPTYNNSGTLRSVLEGVLKLTTNIIVVNDGSTDQTKTILNDFQGIDIIHFPKNQGKGKALRTGFNRAVETGYDYAISIDSDGQHDPADIPHFLDKLETEGPSLIVGARNMDQESVPGKSSFGNKFSNFWFWVETGLRLPDTQSGFRLYPVRLLKDVKFFTSKFEFEIEVLVRAAWKDIPILPVPVSVFYAPRNERVSHFRPFTDFTRISILNTVLVIITILYINPRNFFRKIFRRDTYTHLHHELFHQHQPPSLRAVSVGFGVFMGIVPIWGFQLLVAITLAVLLRLNKALVIISANISIPPMIPFIVYLSYKTGAIWMGDKAMEFSWSKTISLESIHMNFVQYFYGSITLAIVAGISFGMIAYLLLNIRKNHTQHQS